jgi:glycosyltransferase involved in cell wall biosynthesis
LATDPHPSVSIILPAYNSARFLQTTLDSIFAQDYSDYEIIIVDDGSGDDTADIARLKFFPPKAEFLLSNSRK